MSRPIVFLGPSLSLVDARRELDAVFEPPAAQGDFFRACASRPSAIALIDGYFDRVPSVWHKEILWALKEGIPVFGGASMGARRAAELDSFGMIGVGSVYNAFRTGELEDDDEVAVAHASAEHGYRSLSEALVNVRATLRAAVSAGTISRGAARELGRLAKAIHYPDRHYGSLLKAAVSSVDPLELERLAAWLPTGKVNQKSIDALAVLRQVRSHLEADVAPPSLRFEFAYTAAWREIEAQHQALPRSAAGSVEPLRRQPLEDELLVSGQWVAARWAALTRALLAEPPRTEQSLLAEAVHASIEAFRRERGLTTPVAFKLWIQTQGFSEPELAEFFVREARLRDMTARYDFDLWPHLLDHLRSTDRFAPLFERASDKSRVLGSQSDENAPPVPLDADLWRWFFNERLGVELPEDIDLAARVDFGVTAQRLHSAAAREYRYLLNQHRRSTGRFPLSTEAEVSRTLEA